MFDLTESPLPLDGLKFSARHDIIHHPPFLGGHFGVDFEGNPPANLFKTVDFVSTAVHEMIIIWGGHLHLNSDLLII